MQAIFEASWMTLATAQAWIGALIGAAMIVAAVRLRRWRDEG
jgi:ABC-2 type transport system permease protein